MLLMAWVAASTKDLSGRLRPDDLDHLCRNTGCVNVAHLEEVTRSENLNRGDMKNGKRLDPTKCAAGLHDGYPATSSTTSAGPVIFNVKLTGGQMNRASRRKELC